MGSLTQSGKTFGLFDLAAASKRADQSADIAYWKQCLAGYSSVLSLPLDRPRPAQPVFQGASERLHLGEPLTGRLTALAAQEHGTLFDVLLASFQTLLHRYSSSPEIVTGLIVVRRLAATRTVLRTAFASDPSFRELLRQLRKDVLKAYIHKDVPIEKLIESLVLNRDNPHFQVAFQFAGAAGDADFLCEPSARIEDKTIDGCDLKIDVTPENSGVFCELKYNAALFDASTIQRMLGHYRTILEASVENADTRISRLPILTAAEQELVLMKWNDTRADFPQCCVHRLFEQQVLRTPNAVALEHENRKLTFAELNERANRLAHALMNLGTGPGVIVGLSIRRSIEMVVGMLAVLKAGGAYAPLDPAYPQDRLEFLISDLQARILLCGQPSMLEGMSQFSGRVLPVEDWPRITAQYSPQNPESKAQPSDLAYVLYTSGSTGQPKGVLIPHRALVNYLTWCLAAYASDQGKGSPVHSPLGFDLTITSIFPPLLSGRTAVLIPEDSGLDALATALRSGDFSLVKLTPSHLEALRYKFSDDEPAISTKAFVIGGEALHGEILRYWRERSPGIRLINEYGPTESTVGCCVYELPAGPVASSPIPIGRPIANTRLYVLDKNLQPVPAGVPGELHIAGAGLALGYHRRPKQTTEKFIPDPFNAEPGGCLYKTGDLVRYRPDGNLEFLERLDHQVKIRGFRVELIEIEKALTRHPAIREAAVTVFDFAPSDRRLVAYVVLKQEKTLSEKQLRDYLKSKLPDYMLPSRYIFLAALPLTSNGKLDRAALPSPDSPSRFRRAPSETPHDAVERQLVAIWEETLRIRPIGVTEDFFDLGGDSLLALQMLARVEKLFGRRFALGMLLHAPTVARLAQIVKAPIEQPRVFTIGSNAQGPAFFCVAAGPIFRGLANGLDQRFLSLRLPEAQLLPVPYRMEHLAAYCVESIRQSQPEGPYFIGGWSDAGLVAYEIAQQLRQQGQPVGIVVLFDSENPAADRKKLPLETLAIAVIFFWQRIVLHSRSIWRLKPAAMAAYIRKRMMYRLALLKRSLSGVTYRLRLRTPWRTNQQSERLMYVLAPVAGSYEPQAYDGRVILFRRSHRPTGRYRDPEYGWGGIVPNLEIHDVSGDHVEMFLEPNVQLMSDILRTRLEELLAHRIARSAGMGCD